MIDEPTKNYSFIYQNAKPFLERRATGRRGQGSVFEAAVGAELAKLPGELYYWRESGHLEVDFVYKEGRDIWAIEVKSGRKKSARGLEAFQKQFPQAKPVFVTPEHFLKFSRDVQGFLDLAAHS